MGAVRTTLLGAALVLAGCGPLPEGWLYVTGVTPTSATIVWTGDRFEGVLCANGGATIPKPVVHARRRGVRYARVVGLKPGTNYACRLPFGDGSGERRVSFRTAPDGPATFTFAAVGDTGDGSAAAAALAARIRVDQPEFLLHLGDFAYPRGTPEELDERFFGPYRGVLERVPLYPTPGNHDLTSGSGYASIFHPVADGEWNYAFDWGSARFFSVSYSGFRKGRTDGPEWLAEKLAGAAAVPWRIVFSHEPTHTSTRKASVGGLRRSMQPVLERGRADLVLAGHMHLYERAAPACRYVEGAQVLSVVSGGGGSEALDRPGVHPYFPEAIAATHYVRVRVGPDAIEWWAIDPAGKILDHFRRGLGEVLPCRSGDWRHPEPWQPR